MAIHFPVTQEVRLKKSPLSEVLCQVKFPPILRIAKEPPADFQEAIRIRFPGLEVEQGVLLQLGISPAAENPVVETTPKIYRFKSSDSKTCVSLAVDFFALSTNSYTHWDDFVNDFIFVEQVVKKVFSPPFINRVGLRFINRITLKNSGCKTIQELLDLFHPDLTCFFRSNAWSEPGEMISQIVLLDHKARLTLRFGFAREEKEPFFLLDFDYYEGYQLDFQNLSEKIDDYHTKIYQAFRWSLIDAGLEHFDPFPGK